MEKGEEIPLRKCSVCLQDIVELGESVSHVLPCFHDLCKKCAAHLLTDSQAFGELWKTTNIQCSTCSVPSNKLLPHVPGQYIVRFTPKQQPTDFCPIHEKEAILFCKDDSCQKPICQKCLLEEHRTHNFVDIEEEKTEKLAALLANVESTARNLENGRKEVLSAKATVAENSAKSIQELQRNKEEICSAISRRFDQEIQNIEGQLAMSNHNTEEAMQWIDWSLAKLRNFRDEATRSSTHEAITKGIILTKNLENDTMKRVLETAVFSYDVHSVTAFSAEDLKMYANAAVAVSSNMEAAQSVNPRHNYNTQGGNLIF